MLKTERYFHPEKIQTLFSDGEAFIDNTPPLPGRPARRQAKAPDPRSRLGAAAEVGPALAGAGTIP